MSEATTNRQEDVSAIVSDIARADPDRIAIRTGDKTLGFARLDRLSMQLARGLAARLARTAEPVAVVCEDPLWTVTSMLGILRSARIWIVIEPSVATDVALNQLRDASPRLILTDCDRGIRFAHECGATAVAPAEIASEEAESTAPCPAPLALDATACLLYTSGSSGPPKGVMRSHGTLIHVARAYAEEFRIGAADQMVLLAALSRGAGVSSLFRCLLNGATCHLFPLRDAGFSSLRQLLGSGEITLYHSVPTVFRQFLQGIGADVRFPGVRLIHLGGEPVTPLDVELFREHFSEHCRLISNLGATEAPTYLRCTIDGGEDADPAARLRFRAVAEAEVLLLGEGDREVRVGEPGEIVVRSAQLAQGYWKRPELTAQAFPPAPQGTTDRIYRTRDLGRRLADGCIEYLGRRDQQVKIRGQLVDVAQANKAFQGIVASRPDLAAGVLVASELNRHGLRLVAYVQPAPGHRPPHEELRELCVATLPPAMVPSAIVEVSSLPGRPDGAVDAERLPDPRLSDRLTGRPPRWPRLVVEKEIMTIFRDLLRLNRVGIDDSFFDLGGDSVLGLRLLVELENRFGTRLSPASLLRGSSPLRLAALLEEREPDGDRALDGLHVEAPGVPLFAIGGRGGGVMMILKLGLALGPDQPFHALHPPGMNWEKHDCRSLEEMAAYYVEQIRRVQPSGPYRLLGTSFGGVLAFEMTRQLEASGAQIELLAVVDSNPPGQPGGPLPPEQEPPNAAAGRLDRVTREVSRAQKRATRGYRPGGPVRCPILYFMCTGRSTATDERIGWLRRARRSVADRLLLVSRDRRLAWRRHTVGGIRFVPLAGEHGRFGRPPQLDQLVAELRAALTPGTNRNGGQR